MLIASMDELKEMSRATFDRELSDIDRWPPLLARRSRSTIDDDLAREGRRWSAGIRLLRARVLCAGSRAGRAEGRRGRLAHLRPCSPRRNGAWSDLKAGI